MMKSVDGNVLLYDGSPRVGEYAYADRIYEPPDYYGDPMIYDHFLNRSDFNLIKQNENMYMTRSPYMLDKHDGSYRSDFDINRPAFLGNFLGDSGEDLWDEVLESETDIVAEQDVQDSEAGLLSQAKDLYDAIPDEAKEAVAGAVMNEIGKAMDNTSQVANSSPAGSEDFMQAFKKGFIDITGSPLQSISPSVQGKNGKIWIDPNQLTIEQTNQYITWIQNTKSVSYIFQGFPNLPWFKALNEQYKGVEITPSWLILKRLLDENNSMLLKESAMNGARYWGMCRYLALFALENKNAILAGNYGGSAGGLGGLKSAPIIVGLLVGLGAYFI